MPLIPLMALAADPAFTLPAETRQLVMVTTPGWSATTGTLTRWTREGEGWTAVGEPVPVVVGRAGLGWGLGLHPAGLPGPVKAEGDGRAPAGVFRLGPAMGYAAAGPEGARWPYQGSTPGTVCVDDPASATYNHVVGPEVPVAWTSAERMVRDDALYRWLVVVDHNPLPTPGEGSCIFLHVWRAPTKPTVGCTAADEAALVEVIRWLDPVAAPLLVQLPAEVRPEGWGLPEPR